MKNVRMTILMAVGCLLVVLTATSNVDATVCGIEVLSESCHIWGHIYRPERWEEGEDGERIKTVDEYYERYDVTSSSAVSRELSYDGWLKSSSIADPFHIYLFTNAYYGSGVYGSAGANVDATWTFRPLANTINITASWHEYLWYRGITYTQIWLTDITAGVELAYNCSPWQEYSEIGWYDKNYERLDFLTLAVDTTHNYSVRMKSYCESSDDGGWFSDVRTIITPEPTTILLVGLGGMMMRAKKGKRKV